MASTEELVRAVWAGDKAAFAELVRFYERAVVVTAHSVLHDFHASQDAAQEAFVMAYTRIDQLRDPAAFGSWVLTIARRQAALALRQPRTQPIDAESEAAMPATTPSSDWIRRFDDVAEQLSRLPEHERTVVVLRYLDGRSVQEIAGAIGKPVGTVTKQLSRAIERLRKWFIEVQA